MRDISKVPVIEPQIEKGFTKMKKDKSKRRQKIHDKNERKDNVIKIIKLNKNDASEIADAYKYQTKNR